MTYDKTIWKDKVVQRPRTFIETANADGSITHIPAEGTITEAGTPVNASNLNKIENELERLNTITADLQTQLNNKNGLYVGATPPTDKSFLWLKV